MQGKGKIPTFWLQSIEKDLNVLNPRQFTDQATALKKNSFAEERKSNNTQLYNNLNHENNKHHKDTHYKEFP